MADYYLPEEDVHKRPYALLLKDIWWRLCTKAGNILKAPIVQYGADGKPNGRDTTAEAEFGWNRQNFATVNAKLDRIITKLEA